MSAVTEPLYHLELIDGVEVQKPLPKRPHAVVQMFLLAYLLSRLEEQGYDVLPELSVWCGADRLIPDLTVVSQKAQYADGDLVSAADLVIEIRSPGQSREGLFEKARRLSTRLHHASTAWVIDPETREAWVVVNGHADSAAGALQAGIGSGAYELTVPLAEIWQALQQRGL